jgi:hypothetical protein
LFVLSAYSPIPPPSPPPPPPGPGKNVISVLCDTGERYFSLDAYFVPGQPAGPADAARPVDPAPGRGDRP